MKEEQLWQLYCAKGEYETEIKDIFDRSLVNFCRPGNILDAELSQYLKEQGFSPIYPEKKAFATCISHDIDYLFPKSGIKQFAKAALSRNIGQLSAASKNLFGRQMDSSAKLEHLFKLERKYGIQASYYFLSVKADNPEDFNYYISEVSHYFKEIESLGGEVGLHGSKLAFNDAKALQKELKDLQALSPEIVGYRNHYLKFEIPKTWNLLADSGFLYDTTLGAPNSPGFRNGICYPFQPFDLSSGKWIDLYEIPLIAMDVSFFNYLRLDYEMAFKLFKQLVQKVKALGGVFSFLWHNNYVTGEMGAFYEKCLAYLAEENTWFCNGRDMVSWWKEQGYFEQQKELLTALMPNSIKNTA